MATNIDLTASGASQNINGAIFEDTDNTGAGTGNYNTFLAVGDNDGDEQGFNSDLGHPSNPDINAAKTHTLQISEFATVVIGGLEYYEFRVDINEVKSGVKTQISLDQFKVYTSSSGTLASLTDLAGATLRYDLDQGGDKTVLLNQDSSGGGTDDYSVFVLKSLFAGLDPATFVYLFVQMGADAGANFEADDGFDEWRALTTEDVETPEIQVTKAVTSIDDGDDFGGPGQADSEGDVINYSITVENTGNVPLDGVTVVDEVESYGEVSAAPVLVGGFNSGDANTNNILDVGEIWNFTASYTLTQADLDNEGGGDGDLNNLATGDTNQTPEDTDNAVVPLVYLPSIEVTKSVDSIDDDDDFGDSGQADSEGDVVNYLITVANTGNISLNGLVVSDEVEAYGATSPVYVSGDDDLDNVLDVGETWTFSSSYTLTQGDLDSQGGGDGFLDNLATGDTDESEPDSDDESVPLVYAPAIEVTKSVDSIDDDDDFGDSGQADSEGDVVNYLITVANTGNISLNGLVVSDEVEAYGATSSAYVSGDDDLDNVLDVGETWTFSSSYTLTQGDLDGQGGGDGFLDNLATADTDESGPDSDEESVPLVYLPTVDIEKLVSVDGGATYVDADDATGPAVDLAGGNIFFKLVVTNTGNVTLTGAEVLDSDFDLDPGPGVAWVVGGDGILSPGETHELIISAPFQIGQHVNTAVVDSDQLATDTDSAYYFGLVPGPGVRTPGFWQNPNNGGQFWDGIVGNEKNLGKDGFPFGELLRIDTNNDGVVDTLKTDGLLVGDYNRNGVKDVGEDTIFISLKAAQYFVGNGGGPDGREKIGRDLTATWLNFLAGNPIGEENSGDGVYSPKEAINDAIDWLQAFADTNNNGINFVSNKPEFTGPVIKTSSAAWNVDGATFQSGNEIHNALDEYNNDGTVNGVPFAHDADNSLFLFALSVV